MKRFILPVAAIIASFGLAAASESEAATASGNLNVTATIIASCTVTTTPVNFGVVTGLSPVTAAGDISVNCPLDTPYNIALDAGANFAKDSRNVSDGVANSRGYLLGKTADGPDWGDSDFGNTYPFGTSLADVGTGALQSHKVWGYLNGGAALPFGTYSDTVTVTIHY